MNDNDLHALAGAYVMDALDDEERLSFEAFMASSPAAAAEVASLREATALLGAAAAEPPPASLRANVLSQIDTVRQERPVVQLPARRADDVPPEIRVRRTGWVTKVAYGFAAAGVALAIGLGTTVVDLQQRLNDLETTNHEVSVLLVAPDATQQEAFLPDGGRVAAVISHGHGSAVAVAEGLPALDADRMYALWGLVDGSAVPVGEIVNGEPLTVHSAGLDALALTVEPRGELFQPTGDITPLEA